MTNRKLLLSRWKDIKQGESPDTEVKGIAKEPSTSPELSKKLLKSKEAYLRAVGKGADNRVYKNESTFRDAVTRRLKAHGICYFKINDAATSGIPDYLINLHGFFVAIELKQPGKDASSLQKASMRRIIDSKGFAALCYNWGEVKWFLMEVQQELVNRGAIASGDLIRL